jgi:hypothetical protein
MSTTTITGGSRHELATRVNGGLEATLVWDRRDNSTSIELHHAATNQTISFHVPPDRALERVPPPLRPPGRPARARSSTRPD